MFCRCRIWLLVFLFWAVTAPARGESVLRAHFIDVGYADAILLEFPDDTTMLIDAGDRQHSSDLLSYLEANQVQRIDIAVITHPHANHFGGLRKIAARIPIVRVFHNDDPNPDKGYLKLLAYLKKENISVNVLRRGQKIEQPSGAVIVAVLNPKDWGGDLNDNSIALWVRHGKVSLLLLADIGPKRQDELLAEFSDLRKASLIQVPHHGGALSETFIAAFQKKTFVVSTGANRWGLPREDQLQKLNGTVYRTDKNGTIVVESDGNILKVVSWTQNGN